MKDCLNKTKKRFCPFWTKYLLLLLLFNGAGYGFKTAYAFNYHFYQEIDILRGEVVNEDGTPLLGATVSIKGTQQSVLTDSEGKFLIQSPSNSKILVISYAGYKTKEVPFKVSDVLQIILNKEPNSLNEVIVVGYGSKTKGALTGAISTVKSDVFESRPLTNTLNALQGQVPGVTITRGSGQPGRESYAFQIRGYSSINGNQPLILIDGVPGDLNTLNPNDIASVSVLKDAAASIYGARAADGVVIVTTKKGNRGEPTINFTSNYGIKIPHFLKQMTNTLQLAEMYDEGMTNVGQPGLTQDVFDKIRANAEPDPNGGWMKYLENYPGFYQTTDWMDVIYGNSSQQLYNLSISGGGQNNNYLFSAGYAKNNGVFNYGTDKSNRYNLRLNYDFNLFKRLKLETRTSFENEVINEPSQLQGALSAASRMWSYLPIYNPLGQYYGYQGYVTVPEALTQGGTRKSVFSRFNTNLKGDLLLAKGLHLIGQAGINLNFYNDHANNRTFSRYNWTGGIEDTRNVPNSAYYTNTKSLYKIFTGYLEYSNTIGVNHNFSVMAGASHEENDNEGQTTWGYNFRSNDIFTLNLADRTNTAYANFTGNQSDWALQSYFGRFSYSFNNKLFVDITTRADGSSKFSPDKRWSAVFPAVSAAYNFAGEKLFQRTFDQLKLRASWGKTGNQEIGALGLYDYLQLIRISGNYPLGSPNAGQPGAVPTIASAGRTWETIVNQNIGLDLAVLNNRLTFSFDYFTKRNENMLVNVAVPATFGGVPPSQNLGTLETAGWESIIGWADKKGDFRYSINFQISDSKNKLVELKNSDSYGEGLNTVRKGYSMYSYFGYVYNGIIKNEDQLTEYKKLKGIPAGIGIGDVMYADVDGDGTITAFGDATKGTKGDMVYLGNLLPRYTYSSNINVGYKGFDLALFFQGVGRRQAMREGDFNKPFHWVWFQPLEYFYEKTYTADRPDAKYPRIVPGGVGFDEQKNWNWRTSAMRMDNMAYLRLKVITIGYNIPSELTSKYKIQNLRLYVSGQDLFTFSKGTWGNSFDPEELWSRSDEMTYPFNKVISVGLDIKF